MTSCSLLFKKLNGLIISQQTIYEEMDFYYAILHVWCLDEHIEKCLKIAFEEFRAQPEYDNVILLTTTCDYEPIYNNDVKKIIYDYDIKEPLYYAQRKKYSQYKK